MLDAIVIGAGHAGLAMSYRLAQAGLEHVVLERGEVGETWRSQRWDSFTLNTPDHINVLPAGENKAGEDTFQDLASWIAELQRYARTHALPVRTRCAVTAVESDGAGAFGVTIGGGEALRARSVVVASGVLNVANVPPAMRGLDPSVLMLTTASYKRERDLPPGAVLIVGAAQSACQIAEDLLAAGRDVFIASSRTQRFRRHYRGRDILAWLWDARWFHMRPQELPDPAMLRWSNPQTTGIGPHGHTVSYRSLAEQGATLLGRLESVDATRLRLGDDLAANIRFSDERSAAFSRLVDEYIARRGIDAPPPESDPADEPVADASRYAGPHELDLRESGISTVIVSTGFHGDLSYLRFPILDERGVPKHVEGRTAVEGLWVVGFPWLRYRGSGVIALAAEDSAFICEQVVARLNGVAAKPA